jgi:predicted amidohydrolase YtcJ
MIQSDHRLLACSPEWLKCKCGPRGYTSAAARYTFEEGRKGTLEPGKLADLVVLSADYMTVPEDQTKDIKADVTMVGGKVVFQR